MKLQKIKKIIKEKITLIFYPFYMAFIIIIALICMGYSAHTLSSMHPFLKTDQWFQGISGILTVFISIFGAYLIAQKQMKKDIEEKFQNNFDENLKDSIYDYNGFALIKCINEQRYYCHIEIDRYGNMMCKNVRPYKHNSPIEEKSLFYLPAKYSNMYTESTIWLNKDLVASIIFIDEFIEAEIEKDLEECVQNDIIK